MSILFLYGREKTKAHDGAWPISLTRPEPTKLIARPKVSGLLELKNIDLEVIVPC